MDVRIGHLTLQPHRQLTEDGKRVALGRKALDLLSILAKADGAIVSKDELMEAVWPGVIVEENAIQVHMAAVRKALGKAADALVTVRGIGYQLTLGVREGPGSANPDAPLIAVLAFENRSSDPELEYFAEGVSEEILEAVSCIDGVRVIARTSSFQLRDENRQTRAVATILGATHILDGSVRREGDRLRIGAQLVDAFGETVLWSERFDGTTDEVFAFQDSIATAVAGALQRRVGRKVRRSPIDPRAYDLYLQGRLLAGVDETRLEAVTLLEQALAIEPDFAEAWASLALSLAMSVRWDDLPARDHARENAVTAAKRALALDPDCAVALLAFDALQPFANRAARDDYTLTAFRLSPGSPEALHLRSAFLHAVGRVAEAFDCAERNWRTDPLNPVTVQYYAQLLFETGWPDRSYATYALAREKWPHIWWFLMEPILFASFAGQWSLVDGLLIEPGADRREVTIARRTAEALRSPDADHRAAALANARKRFSDVGHAESSQLVFLCGLGLDDEVFSLVEQSDYSDFFKEDGKPRDMIGFHPGIIFSVVNRAMRQDPRFVALCGKLGLCDYWVETGRWPDCADEVPYDFRAEARAWLKDRR